MDVYVFVLLKHFSEIVPIHIKKKNAVLKKVEGKNGKNIQNT